MLWNSAFRCLYLSFAPLLLACILFTAICKASSDSHFAFFAFLFHVMVDGIVSLFSFSSFVVSVGMQEILVY